MTPGTTIGEGIMLSRKGPTGQSYSVGRTYHKRGGLSDRATRRADDTPLEGSGNRDRFGTTSKILEGEEVESMRSNRKMEWTPLSPFFDLGFLEIRARLKETHADLVGFAGKITKPLVKIELEVCFGGEGLCRRTTMKFTVIRAPSPYNVILGRTGLRALRAIPSTIHSMMEFPTRGIATLVTRLVIISECMRLEKKQVVEKEKREDVKTKAVNATEEMLVNPAFPDQLVIIGGRLPETCKAHLKLLLKDNVDIFA
ncbi:hypothetical protein Tco_1239387 [Tanacetum coccineum]